MSAKNLFSMLFAAVILPCLVLPAVPSSCFAGREECPYCKGTGKVEADCPVCRGTGMDKEVCPACKGRDLSRERCEHCKGRDLTKEKCPHCRGKDLSKEKCPKCKGKGKDKNSGKECWDCKGTGHKLACIHCKGTGKQERCWYCKGTGKKGKCEACSGTGRKNKCTACKGTGKTMVECTACRIARLTEPQQEVAFYAVALGDLVVAISVGKTYLVNRSDKPAPVEPLVIAGRNAKDKEIFMQDLKPKGACPPGSVQAIENPLKSFAGVKVVSVIQGVKTVEMKRYEKAGDALEEFLKKGKLEE